MISWVIITKRDEVCSKQNILTFFIGISLLLAIGISRFFPTIKIYKFISVPDYFDIIPFLLLICFVLLIIRLFPNRNYFSWGMIGIILLIFILLKNESLAYRLSLFLRRVNNQSLNLAASDEIAWIGYSYIAFRMVHALIESRKRKGLEISLRSYLSYLFYFPAFLAGPIDRVDHFDEEISSQENVLSLDLWISGERIVVGLFQKFILADTLAIVSLSDMLTSTIISKSWMWFVVIVYTFRIYFDFNGYTNIALGISKLIGIQLPENFNKPLQSPTLTIFWNNWHITLTQWFRSYFFNPLTRFIRAKYKSVNPQYIMALMQISTMVLIGLWHGVSFNFIAWGVWIGIGLFLQNRITGFFTQKTENGVPLWQLSSFYKTISTILTILYVSLRWIWFALPSLDASLRVFQVLFGI